MKRIALVYKKRLAIRQLAANLVNDLPPKAYAAEVERLFNYVKNNIRYTRDVYEVETLQTPDKTLEFGYGDCDDMVLLLATLLLAIGHPVRFVAMGMEPGRFSHVFLETKIGADWVALETTEPVGVGWEPKGKSKMVVHV